MIILPAIDIRNGKCVRLVQGKTENETIYEDNPIKAAQRWAKEGAQWLHVVDLDGAFAQEPKHIALAAQMRKETGLKVELGGGFRTREQVEQALDQGIDKVILGTVAISNPKLLETLLTEIPGIAEHLSISIDASKDYVAIAGWTEISNVKAIDLALSLKKMGIRELHYTDILKDGTLSGPNVESTEQFLSAVQLPLTVAGGMSQPKDVDALLPLAGKGLVGIVIGKALYDGTIQLKDALSRVSVC